MCCCTLKNNRLHYANFWRSTTEKKRTGLAVTDPAQIIANGLTTVETGKLLAFLKTYVKKEPVERSLSVYRRNLTANRLKLTPSKDFCSKLAKMLPEIPIDFYDERFTSVLAHRAMIDGGLGA